MRTLDAGTLACSNSYLTDMDNETDPHSQPTAAELAGISSHPQDMKRVLVMLDPVVKPNCPAINPFG